jgi:CheY-like chemotaxis protein
VSNGVRILIAEDDKDLGPMMVEDLKDAGFSTVDLCENGQDAFNKSVQGANEDTAYDLIISDWDMPVMNGLALLEKVRRNSKTADTPFVLITGVGTQETVRMASRHGVSAIILKPFEKEALIEKAKILTESGRSAASASSS